MAVVRIQVIIALVAVVVVAVEAEVDLIGKMIGIRE